MTLTGHRTPSRQPSSTHFTLGVAALLTVFLASFEAIVLELPLLRYFDDLYEVQTPIGFGIRVVGALAICVVQVAFFWASLTSSVRWRVAYWTVFSFGTLIEYGYVRVAGRLLTAFDFHSIPQDTQYWWAMALLGANWWALVPIVLYGAALTFTWQRAESTRLSTVSLRHAVLVMTATLAVHSSYAVMAFLSSDRDQLLSSQIPVPVSTFQAFARSSILFGWTELSAATRDARETLAYRTDEQPSRHVVLVVDESVEAERLSVNEYSRPTTPWLDHVRQSGRLTNWGVAVSAAPVSAPSVLAILTGIRQLPDRERRALTQATIFQYAKAMNYRTHLFDGQVDRPRVGLSIADLQHVDDFRGTTAFGNDFDTDLRIASMVKVLLRQPIGHFVVVLKRGNHYPHGRNYPNDAKLWSTGTVVRQFGTADDEDPEGSYDDGLRYNVDGFLRGMLEGDGSARRAVVLYTSDHGRSYLEPRRSHAVPLMMFGDGRPAADTGYRASHANIFATLLDLMAFPEERRQNTYARSLLKARRWHDDERLTINGDLFGQGYFVLSDFDRLSSAWALTQ